MTLMAVAVETRVLPATTQQLRAETVDDGTRRLRGYGAVFESTSEDLGGFREVIDPAAFTRTLALGTDIIVTMNHDVGAMLGRTRAQTARVGTDGVGLWYEVDLPDTQPGRDAHTLTQRGDIFGSSFSFTVTKNGYTWGRDDDGHRIRRLTEVRLLELGPVVSPAYLDTTVAARSLADIASEEDRQEASEDELLTAGSVDGETRGSTLTVVRRRLRTAR